MTFQADDTPIFVEVTDKITKAKINASDFVAGKYEILTLAGTVIFDAEFPGDISIVDENFKILWAQESDTQTGSLRHEMRVRDISGKESTIVKTIINNEKTSVRL